jgi:glycosyltransferase involved in cell wall biosynthesis
LRVDQFLPDLAGGDAIGNHALNVRQALRDAGWESDIWATVIHDAVASEARPWEQFDRLHPEPVAMIYHDSTDSPMIPWLRQRAHSGSRLATYYHNITPASYFKRWEPAVASRLEEARSQLCELAPSVELAIADSTYNRCELFQAGYANAVIGPVLVDLEAFHQAPDERTLATLRSAGCRSRWLFVGRIAPNKCQHDVIAAFALYRKLYDPRAMLSLVGGVSSPRYSDALKRLVTQLSLGDSVQITGRVSFGQLLAHYLCADVFVCMSEHEGYCVPVIEAMELGVPVVAFRAGALPETVGAGGILLDSKDPLAVAVEVGELLGDESLKEERVRAGRERASELSLPNTSKRLVELVAGWLSSSEVTLGRP